MTVSKNDRDEIINNTAELLDKLAAKNKLLLEDIGAVVFSSTVDLNATFPAAAARKLGWQNVALFGTQEIENPDGIPYCIRVLILWNTEIAARDVQHIYLREASVL